MPHFVPNTDNPLYGTWVELPGPQRVNPSAVRAIWKARTQAKHLEGGLPLQQAQDDAAYETARMLGMTLRTVRVLCKLDPGSPLGQQRNNARAGKTTRPRRR